MTATCTVTSFECNEPAGAVTAALITLAPSAGDFVISWRSGSTIRVAKITP